MIKEPKSDSELTGILKVDIENKSGGKVLSFERLSGGINNICYKVNFKSGNLVFAKKYYKDKRERLEREYKAVSYFIKLEQFRVPRPHYFNEKIYYAVYDFIDGEVKKPHEVGKKDILDLVDYTVKLHSIKPTKKAKLEYKRDAVLPVFSLQGHVSNLHFKLGRFTKYYNALSVKDKLKKKIDEKDFISRINKLERIVLKPISKKELQVKVKESSRRFNHIDFGFHNVIYKDGVPYFTDYELSGWDDPYRLIGDFMTHELNKTIPSKLRNIYLSEYKKRMNLSVNQCMRLDIAVKLMDIEWVATYLWSIAPEKVALRRASIKNFDLRTYINEQLEKTEERLKKIESSNNNFPAA